MGHTGEDKTDGETMIKTTQKARSAGKNTSGATQAVRNGLRAGQGGLGDADTQVST